MYKRGVAIVGLVTLSMIGLALAAQAVDLNFVFDTKDDIQGWTANEGSKAEWKAEGAEKSAGCLKLTGGHLSADSPVVAFTGADTIAFDYFLHGADTLRMRVKTVGEDAIKKYGGYGNLLLRKADVQQDKWVHMDVKVADLKGTAENNTGKATPEMQFNKLGLMTISAAPDDAYLLVDNVKLVKGGAADKK